MEAIREMHGQWWLPETPEDRVPGRLVIGGDGSCTLELTGGLDIVDGTMNWDAPRVLGLAEGARVTLLNCHTERMRGGFLTRPEHYHQLHVRRALVGAHVNADGAVFTSARIQIENLTTWLAFPIAERSSESHGDDYRATVSSAHPVQVEADGWSIRAESLVQPFQVSTTRERDLVSSEITAYLFLRPASSTTVEGFDEIALRMMDLVTLASGRASGLIRTTLFHENNLEYADADGSVLRVPVEVESYGRRVHTPQPDAQGVAGHQFRFTCNDRPFDALVREWMRVRRTAAAACNVFFGLSYSEPTFTETRLLMTAVAAEALHSSLYGDATTMTKEHFTHLRDTVLAAVDDDADKQWLKAALRNAPTFRERLQALAGVPNREAVEELIDDLDDWARRLVRARNGLAHSGDENGDPDIFRLQWVSSGLITLVLMQELGLDAATQLRASVAHLKLPEA